MSRMEEIVKAGIVLLSAEIDIREADAEDLGAEFSALDTVLFGHKIPLTDEHRELGPPTAWLTDEELRAGLSMCQKAVNREPKGDMLAAARFVMLNLL